jgi:two-component system, response regulator
VNPQTVEILLVEDNPNDLELALRAFQTHKFANSIEVARDGQEALDYLLGGNGREPGSPPRVILLDLKLPKVDGLQVLREIRANETLKHLPVVILTSSREERDIVESYDLGVNSYIVKPVDFDKFVETVQTLGLYWLLLNEPPIGVSASSAVEAARSS